MSFYGYADSHTSTEYNPRAPLEAYNGYPTHGRGFPPCSSETLGAYQNMMPSLVEQIKDGLGEPMKELRDEVTKLRAEVSRIKETVEQREANDGGKNEGKKAKLPKFLSLAVKRLHANGENQFDGSKCYGDRHNVEVADYLKGKLVAEYESQSESIINRVVYRYYESTRRKYLDDQPGRLSAKERNQRNTKVRNRQKQLYNRRKKLCKGDEQKFWNELTEKFMTEEETDSEHTDTFVQRRPWWRSERLEKFIKILKRREHKSKAHPRKKRLYLDEFNNSTVPARAPSWAVTPAHQTSPEREDESAGSRDSAVPNDQTPRREDVVARNRHHGTSNSAALSDQTPRRVNVTVTPRDRIRNSAALSDPTTSIEDGSPQNSHSGSIGNRNSTGLSDQMPRRGVSPRNRRSGSSNSAALSDQTPRRVNVTVTPRDRIRNSATLSDLTPSVEDASPRNRQSGSSGNINSTGRSDQTPRRDVSPQNRHSGSSGNINSAALSDPTPSIEDGSLPNRHYGSNGNRNTAGLTVSEMISELSSDDGGTDTDEFNLDDL